MTLCRFSNRDMVSRMLLFCRGLSRRRRLNPSPPLKRTTEPNTHAKYEPTISFTNWSTSTHDSTVKLDFIASSGKFLQTRAQAHFETVFSFKNLQCLILPLLLLRMQRILIPDSYATLPTILKFVLKSPYHPQPKNAAECTAILH